MIVIEPWLRFSENVIRKTLFPKISGPLNVKIGDWFGYVFRKTTKSQITRPPVIDS